MMKTTLKQSMCVALAIGAAVAFAAEDLPVTDGLKLHFDASVASTIVSNDTGAVTSWNPVTGTMSLVDANTAHPDATYAKTPVKVVAEGGRTGLRLSHLDGKKPVYTFMCFPKGQTQTTRTLFVVSRQIEKKYYGSLVGRIENWDYRLNRDQDKPMTWKPLTWSDGKTFVNGKESVSFADCGGTDAPHVLAATSPSGKWLETLGAAGIVPAGSNAALAYDKCIVHEVVFYNRVLKDAEIAKVSEYLVAKWKLGNLEPNK